MTGGIDYDYDDRHKDARVPEPDNPKRSTSRKIGGLMSGLFAVVLVLAFVVGGAFLYLQNAFEQPGPLPTDETVMINPGDGSRVIAEKLHEQGAISNDRIFLLGLVVHRANGNLRAGEYLISANASMRQIMNKLVAGKSIQYKITIPEGLTTSQVLQRIEEHEVLDGDIEEDVQEGTLLPDTYIFTRGTTRQDVIERMRNAQNKLIAGLWPNRAKSLPISNPYQAVILASIVEKETGLPEERGRVAGVFVNRLKQNMRLQSDPTIVYGIVGGKGALDRPILKSDIARRTEYNTYQIDGLPPTPIANPGRAAIEAALNPAETRDLFFVADGTGGHDFSETLDEHARKVARWRKIERERNQSEASADADDPSGDVPQADPDQTAALQPDPDEPSPEAAEAPASETPANEPSAVEPNSAASQADDPPSPPPADTQADAQSEDDTPSQAEQDTAEQPPAHDADQTDQDAPEQADQNAAAVDDDEQAPEADNAPSLSQTDSLPRPTPKPERGEVSDIARAIIENSPRPKPKPPVPADRTGAAEPDDSTPDDGASTQTNADDLPEAPSADPPSRPPRRQPGGRSPSRTDLR